MHFLVLGGTKFLGRHLVDAAVERGQIRHEVAVTHRICALHVHVDVQSRASAGQQCQAQLQHLIVQHLMRLGFPEQFQLCKGSSLIQVAQVMDRDRKRPIADPLRAVGQDLDPQHRMARSQFRRRGL